MRRLIVVSAYVVFAVPLLVFAGAGCFMLLLIAGWSAGIALLAGFVRTLYLLSGDKTQTGMAERPEFADEAIVRKREQRAADYAERIRRKEGEEAPARS